MKICATCGASVADDADVCPDCGMELASSGAVPAPPNPPAPPASGVVWPSENPPTPPAPAWPSAPPAAPTDLPPAPSSFTVDFGAGGMATPASDFPTTPEPAAPAVIEQPVPVLSPDPAPSPAPTIATAKLTLKRGGLPTAEVFSFGGNAIVGRFDTDSGPVDVDLGPLPEATYVSRHHAEFRFDGTNWFIRDMGSRNGTFWRSGGQGAFSRVVEEQQLASGDEVALGNARFEFKTP